MCIISNHCSKCVITLAYTLALQVLKIIITPYCPEIAYKSNV